MIHFLVHKDDFDIKCINETKDVKRKLDANTSVSILKLDFFKALSKIGKLVQIDDSTNTDILQAHCIKDNVIYAAVHAEPPADISCRFLNHSLGGFMLPSGFLSGWEHRDATMNVVTSEKQKNQMQKGLGKACPKVCVFTPSIDHKIFKLDKNLMKSGDEDFSFTYAGRFISNKGITQTVRALNIWPINNSRFKLIGDFEQDFFIYHSNATHTTFPSFFNREVLDKNQSIDIEQKGFMQKEKLFYELKESDCFIYPSFHEDENFGYAPREAMLCGVPSVVTDFCGLGQLSGSKGAVLKTYPTLGGIRYSLKELRDHLYAISKWNNLEKSENASLNHDFIQSEISRGKAFQSLKDGVFQLLKEKPDTPPEGGWRSKKRIDRLVKLCPEKFKKAVDEKNNPIIDGLYVDGTGFCPEQNWYSEPHFLKSIQSLYTSFPSTPTVQRGEIYRGFWRIHVWEEESAVVEFGFPGPRVKKFDENDFELLKGCENRIDENNTELIPNCNESVKLIQLLLNLGYIVPDIID